MVHLYLQMVFSLGLINHKLYHLCLYLEFLKLQQYHLHLLHLGHRRDDLARIDATEFLGEKRRGAHHEYNRKGQSDSCFHNNWSVNVLMYL